MKRRRRMHSEPRGAECNLVTSAPPASAVAHFGIAAVAGPGGYRGEGALAPARWGQGAPHPAIGGVRWGPGTEVTGVARYHAASAVRTGHPRRPLPPQRHEPRVSWR